MNTDTRKQIETALMAFSSADLRTASIGLLNTLDYHSEKALDLDNTPVAFLAEFDKRDRKFRKDKALFERWKTVEFLFQITDDEVRHAGAQGTLFDSGYDHGNYQSYLFFALDLEKNHYTRTQLADITREINLLFDMPAMLLIRHNGALTFSVIDRRLHKKDQSHDVLEKVKLIKDIRYQDPHRAHIEILHDLALPALMAKHECRDFKQLHEAWRSTLDTNELNKKFYRELAGWYFWALGHVEFPEDVEKNPATRNATNVIRLLTRLIFCWFLKEKGLIPSELFSERKLATVLKSLKDEDSSFYQAILQNLFFGTLNQRMNTGGRENRKFTSDGSFHERKDEYGVKNLYRYQKLFAIAEKEAVKLFSDIPFLNGGLFDCLDNEDDSGKVIYVDGFTRNARKQPNVPNFLFFSDYQTLDLSDAYGDKKRKKEKVRGLINLLDSYKFTVTENTPIEEEIALDPELLGKVFENLLASYNPETGTTARKQTGSFYTPREIVNYMVDESLIAYLEGQLKAKVPKLAEMKDLQNLLREVFAYTEKVHPFDEEEVDVLIGAIDTCKILDPACGSGAFPMGILHKLVFILGKIDPHNERWKQKQIAKAEQIPDTSAREIAVSAIKKDFETNDLDYGRKLYLIENCIYGVDIQPIAIQISKLRFLISLICDQRTNNNKAQNCGVRPLPNLETKFVAANTLISLGRGKGQQLPLTDPRLPKLESELAAVRHRHFAAQRRRDKLALQRRDAEIRQGIANVLAGGGMSGEASHQFAAWDPYDQNASAPFFDAEWMYGITAGFDVVIGNPPYMGFRDMDKVLKRSLQKEYQTATAKFDLYVPFIERGLQLTAINAHLVYICPTAFTKRGHGKAVRRYILANAHAKALVDFEHDQMFGEATNYTGVLLLQRRMPRSDLILQYRQGINGTPIDIRQGTLDEDIWVFVSPIEQILVDHVRKDSVPLGDIAEISEGIVTGLNRLYLQTRDALSGQFGQQFFHPCLRGREIRRFQHDQCSEFVFYPYESRAGRAVVIEENEVKKRNTSFYKHIAHHREEIMSREYFSKSNKKWFELWNQRKIENFKGLRILTPEISDTNRFCIADDGFFYGDTVCGIKPKPPYDNDMFVRFLLGVLNSQLLEWFYKKTTVPKAGGFFIYKVMFLRNMPICIPKTHLQEKIAKQVELCVDHAKAGAHSQMKRSELEINKLVVEAYEIDTKVLKALEKK
ncbi:MAG: Eco57I restriction-modification methylase domain-containing protein [Desulfobacterales bacterium]|uniref:site-specific DNA-methyltransferase (adenine-specific) n=1 Tax=Candidatus Desulfatibia vada TaxID=2841696 RepID=A0A8J6NYG4_9BACT|nr:Eco57I restriction-modification methylase domain-containing protein [Candidatus Desulfatibia vada]